MFRIPTHSHQPRRSERSREASCHPSVPRPMSTGFCSSGASATSLVLFPAPARAGIIASEGRSGARHALFLIRSAKTSHLVIDRLSDLPDAVSTITSRGVPHHIENEERDPGPSDTYPSATAEHQAKENSASWDAREPEKPAAMATATADRFPGSIHSSGADCNRAL